MDPMPTHTSRWLLLALQVGTLLLLAAMTVGALMFHRAELETRVVRQLEQDLRDRIEAWESGIVDQVETAAEAAAADPSRAQLFQGRLRQDFPWFDSLYLWEPATLQGNGSLKPGGFAFPLAHPTEERLGVHRHPCIVQGAILRSQSLPDSVRVAEAIMKMCEGAPASVRIVALTDAVHLLLEADRPHEAQIAIATDDLLPEGMPLRQAIALGIPAYRAVVLRLEQADILVQLGDIDAADELRTVTGFEILELDGPDARNLVGLFSLPIQERQAIAGHEDRVNRLASARGMAIRRINAYSHVRDNLLLRLPSQDSASRWVYDQYASNSFLLYTRWAQGGRVGVALQVDQEILLKDFLEEMRSVRKHLSITNADGTEQVAGVTRPGEASLVIPFSTTLTHLRVELRQEAVDARVREGALQWRVPIGFLIVVCAIGGISIYMQVGAQASQDQLLQRQRDFATRVTHELKTPLAGIKVMAENLELGYFSGDRERAQMAASIVQEADRLTARVNEILNVAREREVRPPEPFDPEEPLLQAVDQWAPRMDQAGLMFEADLHATDEVLGDAEALRDAVSCLLDNALKYARDDADPPSVWLTLTQEGSTIAITVTDNGLGVPAAQRASIFEKFVRVEGPNRGLSGGHGLGLAQVAEITRAHRGRVTCTDGVDGGARFTIELPARVT